MYSTLHPITIGYTDCVTEKVTTRPNCPICTKWDAIIKKKKNFAKSN